MGRRARRHAGERALDHLSFPEQPLQPARHPPVGGRLSRFFNHRRNYTYIFGESQGGRRHFFKKSFRGVPAKPPERPEADGPRPPSDIATYSTFGIIVANHVPTSTMKQIILSSLPNCATMSQHGVAFVPN